MSAIDALSVEDQAMLKGLLREKAARQAAKTAVGIVHPDGTVLRSIKRDGNAWYEVDDEPRIWIPEKLEPLLLRPKRLNVIVGGRGSAKSISVGDLILREMHDDSTNWMCLREYQSSTKDSVHGLLASEVTRLQYDGFTTLDQSIRCNRAEAKFAGLARNPDSVKSAFGFEGYWVEEAQFLSEDSIKILTPTARNLPVNGPPGQISKIEEDVIDLSKVKILFTANPEASTDPFSRRFLIPFQDALDKHGIYEDHLHLIIRINWRDNPWYGQSGLEEERAFDYENESRAKYDWVWEGGFNDEVDNSIIKPEWFDAALDAHKLEHLSGRFRPHGAVIAAHDPSDLGTDSKGFAMRHGSIVTAVRSKDDGDVNQGLDWATSIANSNSADHFVWDCDGMGISLKREVAKAFEGKRIQTHQFRGSLSGIGQDNAERNYEPSEIDGRAAATYSSTFKNNRAQYYWALRNRFYYTYRAVVKGEYIDPEMMISIDSEGVDNLAKLRSEVCRIPGKDNPNGLIQIMSKAEMARLKISSPNMADALMMTMITPTPMKRKRTKSTWRYQDPLNF
jgi:phage terminase large subunit